MKKTLDQGFSKENHVIDPFEFGDEFFIKTDNVSTGTVKEKSSLPVKVPLKTTQKKIGTQKSIPEPDSSEIVSGTAETDSLINSLGFRIQIGVFDDRENAQESADNVSSRFNLPVYIEYKAPFFRVMLGNFKTIDETEKFIENVRNEGFSDARWVPSNLNNK